MEALHYLILILIWAGPIIVLQWLVGIDILIKRWRVWIPCILISALYLTIVDGAFIAPHSRAVNPTRSLGVALPILNVPLEQGLLYLATATILVQALILLMYHELLFTRLRGIVRLIRRSPLPRGDNPPPPQTS